MPAFCSKGRLPPPAPTKTNFAWMARSSPVAELLARTSQPLSVFFSPTTRCPEATPQPGWRPSHSTSFRDNAPKFTSVPSIIRVAATGISARWSTSSGAQLEMTVRSVENSIPRKK
jgi:hypothetical protein